MKPPDRSEKCENVPFFKLKIKFSASPARFYFYFNLQKNRPGAPMINKIFRRSHLPQQCDKRKISLHRSQVTGCNKLIELVQYVLLDTKLNTKCLTILDMAF